MRLDANFDESWGDKLELTTLLEHGKEGRHTVTIRLAETHEDDAVPFYLVSVIARGEEEETDGKRQLFCRSACKRIAKSEKMLEDKERHCDCRSRRL